MWGRALLLSSFVVLGGCAAIFEEGMEAPPEIGDPPTAECVHDRYAFAGRGTFAELGLVGQTSGALPEPHRPAVIWVSRDPVPFEAAVPEGSPVDAVVPEGSRMLCFEFDDGSGGVEWAVDPAWEPPGAGAESPTIPWPSVAVVTALVVGGAILAFRRR